MRAALVAWLFAGAMAFSQNSARPFPQHVAYTAGTILPGHVTRAQLDAVAAGFYDAWKARYIHPGCVPGQLYVSSHLEEKENDAKTISLSEGHGYGMLITALMAGHDPHAQTQFDQLYAFFRAHPSRFAPDLMAWRQVVGCKDSADNDSATDADMDIAYALLLADAQWGNAGPIHYRDEARKVIAAIQRCEINAATPSIELGDWVPDSGKNLNATRVSDFMTNHFRAFYKASGDALWLRLIDSCYTTVDYLQAHAASATGLVPDFANALDTGHPVPARAHFLESKFDGDYSYNACRFPLRIGVDCLLTGDPRAKAAVEKINLFIQKKTGGNPAAIRAGYQLASGKVLHDDDTSLAFIAPFAVSAMVDASHQEWLDKLWNQIVATPITGDDAGYYGNTLKLLCLLVLSGNWWSP